nr:succinylglutamate desuccinylase/aspartoacylase family protein [Mameliella sp. CS4]
MRVPHSTHDSAYGWIGVPIVCLANGPGPTVLMTGGTHGDEYEGQIAVTRLARELDPSDIRGRLILIPALNAPAAEAGRRCSPIDDGNLNRSFPGNPSGTPTEMIAHYVEEVLLPRSDVLIDLHSGGSSLLYPPTVLHALDMLPDYRPDPAQGTREVQARGSVYAYDPGIFEPFKQIADPVAAGDPLGQIHDPLRPWAEPIEVLSPLAGFLLAKRVPGRVSRGDAVAQIASDI